MTRRNLKRTLRRIYMLLAMVLFISLLAKTADHFVFLRDTGFERLLKDVYEFLRDMALLIITGGVAYLTNVFQRRHSFLENLKAEWREIIAAKSKLLAYMHKPEPTHDDYIATYTCLSEAIDNMRTVYRNVGETGELIGLYPYAPLHDMRRVLQTLNPNQGPATPEQRKLARDTMLQSFYALRDSYLDELDLDVPDTPLLPAGARRLRRSGTVARVRSLQDRQIKAQQRVRPAPDAHDELLTRLYKEEADNNGGASSPAPRTG